MKKRININCDLQEFLNETGITQMTLAKKTGLSRSAISRYVSGERVPNVVDAHRIASFFRAKIEDIWY